MLLIGVKDQENWLLSRWNLTYSAGWEQILRAVHSAYDYYEGLEVLLNDKAVDIYKADDILELAESSALTFRGFSEIIGVPLTITLVNQSNIVDVGVAKATDEFRDTDYKRFNMSLCQYLDSIELAMYRSAAPSEEE